MTAIETTDLKKHFGDVKAIDGVTTSFDEHRIHGLLGRNGAGKTTLMKLITGQIFATSGNVSMLGARPLENPAVLSRTTFIQESQKYPQGFRPLDLLRLASSLYPNWDDAYATELIELFGLPLKRDIAKVSRGQLSMVGIILGLASRSEVTFFDEPYLGLDAVARQLFFEQVLTDFAEHPRTIILSTHHIDEASKLLEHVVVLDKGKVLLDAETADVEGSTIEVSGRADAVKEFALDKQVLKTMHLGSLSRAVVEDGDGRAANEARAAGLDVSPVSLQQLIVNLTTASTSAPATSGS